MSADEDRARMKICDSLCAYKLETMGVTKEGIASVAQEHKTDKKVFSRATVNELTIQIEEATVKGFPLNVIFALVEKKELIEKYFREKGEKE